MKRFFLLLLFVIVIGAGCATKQIESSKNLSGQPKGMSAETEIDLSNRGLTSIPSTVFSRTTLVKLDLSKNQLTGAPPSQIGQLKKFGFS
jgi:Leucine-rich repeat (LRR) protein